MLQFISCPSREKRLKGCIARIVPNHSAFRKWNHPGVMWVASVLRFSNLPTCFVDSWGRTIWIADALTATINPS